jgi:hypothetical protein
MTKTEQRVIHGIADFLNSDGVALEQMLPPALASEVRSMRHRYGDDRFEAFLEMQKAIGDSGGELPTGFAFTPKGMRKKEPAVAMRKICARTERHVAPLGEYERARPHLQNSKKKLGALVDSWATQPDFGQWRRGDPALYAELISAIAQLRPSLNEDHGRVWLSADVDKPDDPTTRAKLLPYVMFLRLLAVSPGRARLRRCDTCRRYYVNQRKSQAYRCRACAQREAARKATGERQSNERYAKLHKAQEAYFSWVGATESECDWKIYVSQVTGFTQKFLTRNRDAITKGTSEDGAYQSDWSSGRSLG